MVTVERFNTLLKKRGDVLSANVLKTPKLIAEWGANKAKSIAPRDTGALIQAISFKEAKSSESAKGTVFVRNISNIKYPGRIAARVPRYAAIQHHLGLNDYHQAKTGDPHWGFTIKREGREKFKQALNLHIQKFIGTK